MSVLLPVTRLAERYSPLSNPPWVITPIETSEVLAAIAAKRICSERYPDSLFEKDWPRDKHIARIAFLAIYGWTEPLDIDVGVPALGCFVDWPILDGNHRLCAAIVRGDSHITALVGGDLDLAFELFGVECAETSAA